MTKKILVLLGILALVSGAWATDYSWAATIEEVPAERLPPDLVCYLIDKNITDSKIMYDGGAVMAKVTLDYKSQTPEGVWILNYTSDFYNPEGDATKLNYKGMSQVKVEDGIPTVTLEIGSTSASADAIQWNSMGSTLDAVNSYAQQYLVGIIRSDSVDRQLNLKVTANNSKNHLGSYGTFSQVIPEPTSGLLLLLGVAGLALKRKKAA